MREPLFNAVGGLNPYYNGDDPAALELIALMRELDAHNRRNNKFAGHYLGYPHMITEDTSRLPMVKELDDKIVAYKQAHGPN